MDGVGYETPLGYRGKKILVFRHLLDNTISILKDGKLVRLFPVDLHDNAINRRAKKSNKPDEAVLPPPSAAQISFKQDFGPIVNSDGGFEDKEKDS